MKKKYDLLIIGSGIAGMFAAVKAAQKNLTVALVSKKELRENNSAYAQGGISCVIDPINDSFESHLQDTLEAGAGLCRQDIVSQIVAAGPQCINDLIEMGVHFTRRSEVESDLSDQQGQEFDLGKEGGHSARRILHAGDITGAEMVRALAKACFSTPGLDIYEHHHAIDLLTTARLGWGYQNNDCLGAYVLDKKSGEVITFLSKTTILATGGAGKVYQYTTNPAIATGDGVGMAYRANAEIANMEFFQFHPTCLFHHQINSFLISEAVRGEGAILKIKKNGSFQSFMDPYHKLASLAPRDIVARAIDKELKESGEKCVYLDITHHDEEFLRKRFPTIFETLEKCGINMAKDLIPVVPAAHYCCGGVLTDFNATTSITRLYAIGEVASTGLHGANRLASNSLLETVVMASQAINHAEKTIPALAQGSTQAQFNAVPNWETGEARDSDENVVITHNWQEIRSFMWDYVGIFRTTKRLQRAKRRIRTIQHEINHYYWNFHITADLIELRNLASVAEIIIDSALSRDESRGLHFNLNFPETKEQATETIIRRK